MQISPLSTLEPSFEALNVKKFDGEWSHMKCYISVFSVGVKILFMLEMGFHFLFSCICCGSFVSSDICTIR